MLIMLWHSLAKVKRKEVGLMQNKDWSYLLGQKIGLLTVLEIYPPGVISIRPKRRFLLQDVFANAAQNVTEMYLTLHGDKE